MGPPSPTNAVLERKLGAVACLIGRLPGSRTCWRSDGTTGRDIYSARQKAGRRR